MQYVLYGIDILHFNPQCAFILGPAEKVSRPIFDFSIDFLFGIAPKRNKKV